MKLLQLLVVACAITLGSLPTPTRAAVCLGEPGGMDICTKLIPASDWQYSLDDCVAPLLTRSYSWCVARGGTWDPTPVTGPVCVGGASLTGDNLAPIAEAYERHYHDPICTLNANDTGWVASAPAVGGWCGAVNEVSYDGVIASQPRRMHFTGSSDNGSGCGNAAPFDEYVSAGRLRTLGCPPGFVVKDHATRGYVCVKVPPCEKCLGNPVDANNGAKMQRETDYVFGGPGGPGFERFYNSQGYYSRESRVAVLEDFWRHSYAAEIMPISDIPGIIAAARRPEGVTRFFRADGKEFHNVGGGAHVLQKLVDGGGATTGWRLTTAESDVELYDAQGRLSSITRRAGHVLTLAYDGQQRLQSVTDSFGRALAFTHDGFGRLATMTDPAGRAYTYGYDAQGRLASVTYPGGVTRTYLYEDAAFPWGLTGIVDERNSRLSTYTYDSIGRVASTEHAGQENRFAFTYPNGYASPRTINVVDAFGVQRTYEFRDFGGVPKMTMESLTARGTEHRTYDANGNPATRFDRLGTTTTYTYDSARNLEISRTEASGRAAARTITTSWHPTYRLPAQVTEPSGVAGVNLVTAFTYDASGNLLQKAMTAGALSRQWSYTYNALGQVLTVDGPRMDVADVTTMTYYAANDPCAGCRGQVHTVTSAAGHVTTFGAYTADGRPTQVTDANGAVTTLTYTARGWLETRTHAGETTAYEYDAVGNLTRVTFPGGAWIAYQYDAANGLVQVSDRLGNAIQYELDVMGNRVGERTYDPGGALRKAIYRAYDAANRLFQEVGAQGQTTEYAYTDLLPTLVKDPFIRTTQNVYDELGRLTRIRDASAGYTDFTYDAKDRLKSVKDPRGLTTSYTYNGLGDLLAQASPDTGTTTFTHDTAGNVATQSDARGITTTYAYDSLNRVVSATVADGTVTYEYDNTATGGPGARGRLTKVTDPSGSTSWAYDLAGRVIAKAQTVGAGAGARTFTVGYGYTAGLLASITYPSGRVVTLGHDPQGQATSLAVDGGALLSGGVYFPFGGVRQWTWANGQAYQRLFDADGRVSGVTLGPSTHTWADLNQAFGYDVLDRLTSAGIAAGQTLGFSYDANGNRTGTTLNGGATTTYTYPGSSHRLSSLSGATSRSFTYDAAGNLTASAGITYTYDGRGRLKQAGSATYLVNGLGQRVRKTAGAQTHFAYDEAGRLLGEYDSTGAAIQEYVWLGDLPVAVVRPASPGGFTAYYVWADHLGTPRVVSDAANVVRWEWANANPFGAHAPDDNPSGAGAFAFNLRFPGQYFDQETGLHYNYFRDYDPGIGRYVQSDPIGLDGGPNTYGYVGGSPLNFADAEGLRPAMGTEPDPQYRWRPEPGDRRPGEVDGGCLVICLAIKMALGTAVANDFEKLGPLMRDRSLGFGSRGTRLMIGRGGAAIGAGMRAMGKTPPGVLIGLGMSMEFCDVYCQKPQVCPVPFVSQLNNAFNGFPPLPMSRP